MTPVLNFSPLNNWFKSRIVAGLGKNIPIRQV